MGLPLHEIRLPAGDIGSISIDWIGKNGAAIVLNSQDWLSKGHPGVRLVGAGVDKTHVRCTSHDGNTITIGRHKGAVQLEGVTLYAGGSRAVFCGQQNYEKEVLRRFKFGMVGCKAVVPPPPIGGGRTKWLLFGYQSDVLLQDCELDATNASEHAFYWHGAAHLGWFIKRTKILGAGAEGFKVRSDSTETAWAGPQVRFVLEDSEVSNWYQTWSDRGGAAIVLQGAAANVLIQRNRFWGGAPLVGVTGAQRCKAVMISSEADSYDIVSGKVGIGFGNGDVVIRNNVARGTAENFWGNTIVRCGQNGGTQSSARSFLLEDSGLYGPNTAVQIQGVPKGRGAIRGCNTAKIKTYCSSIGFDTTHEAVIPTATRLVPVSEGIVL